MSADPDLDTRLRRALEDDVIRPAFQPIVRMDTKRISSFAVLARWTDAILGVVPPATFIPVLEQAGLIAAMTERLICRAGREAKGWTGDFRLTFNVSPLHFQDGTMPSLLEDAIGQAGFPLERTQIEITESALLQDVDAARATIGILRAKGVHVLLNDFGTGYSSLARLQALPFDKIKIDASFVGTLETSRDSRKIVAAVIGLGQSLGVPIIAEGIETQGQDEILRHLGCDFGQGWLYSRAVSAGAVPALLEAMGQTTWDPLPTDLSTNQRLAQLEAIYSLVPVGFCFVDTALRVLKINQKWFELLGDEAREGVGRDLEEITPQAAGFAEAALLAARSDGSASSQKIALANGAQGELTGVATRDETDGLIGLSLMLSPGSPHAAVPTLQSPRCSPHA